MKAPLLTCALLATLSLPSLAAKPLPTAAAAQRIDALLADGWKKNGLEGNAIVDDSVFVRRAYLTVIGRIPTVAETRRFLTWQAPDKREKLIDELLDSEGYVQHFFNYWADILRAKSTGIGGNSAAEAYLDYIRESLRDNKPFDQMARELVTAEGECFDNKAVGYYLRDSGMPLDNLSNTTRIFIGTQLECAQCHNHPFDRWTQMEFFQLAAFTHNMAGGSYSSDSINDAQAAMRKDKSLDKNAQDLIRKAITEATRPLRASRVTQRNSSLRLPHDYNYTDAKPKDVVKPAVLFGEMAKPAPAAKASTDKKAKVEAPPAIDQFAQWLTSPENPRFTRVIANRMWKQVFGLALIEPLDALTDSTVPSNPALMEFLEGQMVAQKYDMKAFLRTLLKTKAFQRASTPEDIQPGMPYYFPGPVFRRMTAEQIWDSMVTLVNAEPDEPNWTLRERERQDFEKRARLSDLLEVTEPELIMKASREVAKHMTQQNKEFDQLRVELDKARANKDSKRINDIQRTLGTSQRVLRETVSRAFYNAARKSGNKEVKNVLESVCEDGDMEMAMMSMMDGSRVSATDRDFSDEEMAEIKHSAADLGIAEGKSFDSYLKYRRSLHQKWCRASELPSPAPRGHFLREFGQSDRDIIENASQEASVPQVLAIMNSALTQELSGGWSAINTELQRAKTPEEKVQALYMALYSRAPSDAEAKALLTRLGDRAKDATVWQDLILAGLATQQFLFVE